MSDQMTTPPPAPENGAATLTESEIAALWNSLTISEQLTLEDLGKALSNRALNNGWCSPVDADERRSMISLHEKGLVMKHSVQTEWRIAPKGERVLAQAAGEKPETEVITARQFTLRHMKELIAAGKVKVTWNGLRGVDHWIITDIITETTYSWRVQCRSDYFKEEHDEYYWAFDSDTFTVTWFPATAQAVPSVLDRIADLPPEQRSEFVHLYNDPKAFADALATKHLDMLKNAVDEVMTAQPVPVGGESPETGWYYSSVAQWFPEYSIEKINGYDGPFPTQEDALQALFVEISHDEDEDRKLIATLRAQLAALEADKLAAAGLVEAAKAWAHMDADAPMDEGIMVTDHLLEAVAAYEAAAGKGDGK